MNIRYMSLTFMLLAFTVPGCSQKNSETNVETKKTNENSVSAKTEISTVEELAVNKPVKQSKAQLFEGMGDHKRSITTDVPEAQKYFNQGLIWMWAFNYDEAIRSFRQAAELDNECAMAWWGVSYSAGPQHNHPQMTEARTATAWEGMQNALDRIENTTPLERVLIEALKHRNVETEPDDRTDLNVAYAQAMEIIWAEHPDDADVGTLYAEAMMVLRPWKLFSLDQVPHKDTPKILAALERATEINPEHPGALHLYIHAFEASGNPGHALEAADRLSNLVPASGHLLHMPSHIYVKTGYWEKAITRNELAMRADMNYRKLSPDQLVQHVYMTHNAHMRAYASMMTGREKEAMAAAHDMWANVDEDTMRKLGPAIDRWMCSVYDVQKRFGRWDDILNEPAPPSFMPVTTAVWHTSRAVAYAAKKDFENAKIEHAAFKKVVAEIPEDRPWGRDLAVRVLEVSDYFIEGEIALQQEQWDKAAELLKKAAAVEDTLGYGEPPQWLQPVRHTLGAVYMKSNQYAEAERIYREDLAKWPQNGWSLFGLSRALEKQGKTEAAKEAMEKHLLIWEKADAPIATSCKCIPKT